MRWIFPGENHADTQNYSDKISLGTKVNARKSTRPSVARS